MSSVPTATLLTCTGNTGNNMYTGAATAVHARALPAGKVVGRLQILTSNYGLPGKGMHDEQKDKQAAVRGMSPGTYTASGNLAGENTSGDWRLGVPASLSDVKEGARHRVRARPLTSSHPELRALIKSRHHAYDLGESRARQEVRKSTWKKEAGGAGDVRALTDGTCISTTELDLLIRRYPGTKKNTIHWRDFLHGFTGFNTSTKSSKSSKKKKKSSKKKKKSPLEKQLRKILAAAFQKGMNVKETFEHFDKSREGSVNYTDFRSALKELGFHSSLSEMNELTKRFDANNDGQITIMEFTDFAMNGSVVGMEESVVEKKLHQILKSAHDQGLDYEEAFESFDRDGTLSLFCFE